MSATPLPKLVSLVLLAVLVAAAVRAFLGAPPEGRRVPLAPLALAAVLAYGGAFVLGFAEHERALAALAAAAGALVSCFAGWIARGDEGREGWDSPGEPPVGPIDWERFERDFRDYAERRGRPSRTPELAGRR